MDQSQLQIEMIAKDIQEYFGAHPHAGDTLEGITQWWVSRQRLQNARELVTAALQYLIARGDIQIQQFGSSEVYTKSQPH